MDGQIQFRGGDIGHCSADGKAEGQTQFESDHNTYGHKFEKKKSLKLSLIFCKQIRTLSFLKLLISFQNTSFDL